MYVRVQYIHKTHTVIQLHKAATLTLQTHVILATLQCVLILIKSCKSNKACTQRQRQQQKQQQHKTSKNINKSNSNKVDAKDTRKCMQKHQAQ